MATELAGAGAVTVLMWPPVRVGSSDHDVLSGVTSLGGVTTRMTLPLKPLLNTASFSVKTRLSPTRVGPLVSSTAGSDLAL